MSGPIKCTKCGTTILLDAKFCADCGHPSQPDHERLITNWLRVVTVAIWITLGTVVLWLRDWQYQSDTGSIGTTDVLILVAWLAWFAISRAIKGDRPRALWWGHAIGSSLSVSISIGMHADWGALPALSAGVLLLAINLGLGKLAQLVTRTLVPSSWLPVVTALDWRLAAWWLIPYLVDFSEIVKRLVD